MKSRPHTRRNVFLVILLFFLMALAVAAVRLFPRNTIPRESAETAARRADRENNGWYLLEQLLAEVPARPQALWGPLRDDPRTEGNYQPEPGSVGSRVSVDRPDDDPLLQEYVASASRLAPLVREVLAKPYILLPPEASNYDSEEFCYPGIGRNKYFAQERSLFPLLLAHAFILSGRPGGSAESAEVVRNAFELMDRMREAGAADFPFVSGSSVFDVLPRLQPEQQRALLEWAVQMQARQRPSPEKIEFDLRRHKAFLDALMKEGSLFRPIEAVQYIRHRTLFMRHVGYIRHRTSFTRHLDYAFKTAYMYPNEFEELAKQDPIVLKFEQAYYFGFSLASNLRFNASWNYLMNCSILILAIELYRHDNGGFPASLEELVPAYIATLPDDVHAGRGVTYRYERTAGAYRLLDHTHSNDKAVFARELEPREKAN